MANWSLEMTNRCRGRGNAVISTENGRETLDCTHQAGRCDFAARNSLRANQEVILLLADSQLEERHVLSDKRKEVIV